MEHLVDEEFHAGRNKLQGRVLEVKQYRLVA